MNKIKAVVIDDEFFNRALITMLITRLNSSYIISGEAESVKEGYKLINEIKPDVVFLDIKMPDGSGFDLLKKFTTIHFEVVFITGFDNYPSETFEPNTFDYILKPVDLDKFKQKLDDVERRLEKNTSNNGILPISDELNTIKDYFRSKIPILYNNRVILLPLNEVQYITSTGNSTIFFKSQNEKYSSSKLLSEFASILSDSLYFISLGNGTYINLNFVAGYCGENSCFIEMKDGAVMEISSEKKLKTLEMLDLKNGI